MINDNKLAALIKKSKNIVWQKKEGDLYFSDGYIAIKTTNDVFNKFYKKTKGAIYEKFGGFEGKESDIEQFFINDNFKDPIIDTNLKYLDNKIFKGINFPK